MSLIDHSIKAFLYEWGSAVSGVARVPEKDVFQLINEELAQYAESGIQKIKKKDKKPPPPVKKTYTKNIIYRGSNSLCSHMLQLKDSSKISYYMFGNTNPTTCKKQRSYIERASGEYWKIRQSDFMYLCYTMYKNTKQSGSMTEEDSLTFERIYKGSYDDTMWYHMTGDTITWKDVFVMKETFNGNSIYVVLYVNDEYCSIRRWYLSNEQTDPLPRWIKTYEDKRHILENKMPGVSFVSLVNMIKFMRKIRKKTPIDE